ncbi:hypothetical protein MTO96_020669, partial [Rhipicephalus appendiculatus]
MSSPPPRLPASRKQVGPSDPASPLPPTPGKSSASPGQASSLLSTSQKPPNDTVFGVTNASHVTGCSRATGLAVACFVKKLTNDTGRGVANVADVAGLRVVSVAVFNSALAGTTRVGVGTYADVTKLTGATELGVVTVTDVAELADATGLGFIVTDVISGLAGAVRVVNVGDIAELASTTGFGVVTVADVTELAEGAGLGVVGDEGAVELAYDTVLVVDAVAGVAGDTAAGDAARLTGIVAEFSVGHAGVAAVTGFGVVAAMEFSELAEITQVEHHAQQQRLPSEGARAESGRERAFAEHQGQLPTSCHEDHNKEDAHGCVEEAVLGPGLQEEGAQEVQVHPESAQQVQEVVGHLHPDLMLFVDMMLNFRTGIDDRKQGIVIMDPVQIRQHYLRGWFPVDLVSSLPLDFLVLNWPSKYRDLDRRSTLSQLAKLISFVKLIKISRLFRYGGRTEQIMFYQTTGVYLQLGNILALIFLAVHWHACLQFFVGSLMGFPPESWISIAKLQ